MIVKGLDSNNTSILLAIDSVLPEQFFATCSRKINTGTTRLMAAVLADGIHSYLKGKNALARQKRLRRLSQEAADWFGSTDMNYIFSFEHICSVLGIDAGAIREWLSNDSELQLHFHKHMEVGRHIILT